MANPVWHQMQANAVARQLGVDPARGLPEEETGRRLREYGPNQPTAQPTPGLAVRFGRQLAQPLVLVLVLAGVVTALLGEWLDAGVIAGVVLVNALVGLVQEGKAQAAIAALARSVAAEATVLRGGARRRIGAQGLVPGDVVVLAAGDKVPADLRLLDARELQAAEAVLTGESTPVIKHMQPVALDAALAERRSMAYAGTLIVSGSATGIVVATGDHTEAGRIGRMIAEAPELATPLLRKLARFSKQLLVAILLLAVLTFAAGLLRGESAFDMFMAAVALAIGAIPEGLPAAMTITLAIGVKRMARRRAIIRNMPAVETLGSTTIVCTDKTGTLTENAMTVRELWTGGEHFTVSGDGYCPDGAFSHPDIASHAAVRETCIAAALCNDARLVEEGGEWLILGDPTEGALQVLARKSGLDGPTLAAAFARLDELPFDSQRQYMATLHAVEGARIAYVKGALEKLLPGCTHMLDAAGNPVPFERAAIEAAAGRMAAQGLRVLAMARSGIGAEQQLAHEHIAHGMVFLGLAGMIDPPRQGAIASVAACHAAGVRVKMITGDHPGTARAIARQLGIAGGDGGALTGRELAALSDEALSRAAAECDVFARVEPEQKLRLVRALQGQGEIVAMTGDGVNDAPALKQADIGVAMGRGGTEVAKEAADMILTDDNFATIEAAIEEGRGIYDNLVKFIAWTVPTNAGEGLVILAAVFAGAVLPIAPLQILWINLTTAILLGLSLAFEPPEPGIMQRPPRRPDAPVLDRVLLLRSFGVALVLLAGAFALFELAVRQGRPLEEARTVAVNLFTTVETFYLLNCRSLTQPFWRCAANGWLWLGIGAMTLLQMGFTYAPALNRIFGSAPIGIADWGAIVAVGVAAFALIEGEKWWRARERRG